MATEQYDPVRSVAKRVGINLIAQGITWGIIATAPFLLAIATVVAGYLQLLPWPYILVTATFVFAATATGLLRLSELRARSTAVNKMSFQGIALASEIDKDRNGRPKTISRAQLGVVLHNAAHFPMSYYIEEIETSFESMVNTNPDRKFRGSVVPANSSVVFRDASIECKNIPTNKSYYDGYIKVKVRYGIPGWDKHYIEQNSNVNLAIDPKTGNLTVIGTSDRVT